MQRAPLRLGNNQNWFSSSALSASSLRGLHHEPEALKSSLFHLPAGLLFSRLRSIFLKIAEFCRSILVIVQLSIEPFPVILLHSMAVFYYLLQLLIASVHCYNIHNRAVVIQKKRKETQQVVNQGNEAKE